METIISKLKYVFLLILCVGVVFSSGVVFAEDTVEGLSSQIDNQEKDIKSLDAQIAADKRKLQQLEGQKNSLSKTITNLDYSRRTLERDIYSTSDQIDRTDKEITSISEQIIDLQENIETNKKFISETIQELSREQEKTFWEVILFYDTFSKYLDRIAHFESTGKILQQKVVSLGKTKSILENKNEEKEEKKEQLVDLTEQLSDKKKVVEYTKQEKQKVLAQTKNTEQRYQQTLSEKLELKKQFEQTLLELESRLQIAIDKSLFAGRSQGLFSWPVSNFRITQFFGNTSFAKSGAYNGRGHSGTDFAVPTGTPVRAVMDGTVWSAFNTDGVGGRGADGVYRQCVSYGKYVLIKHDNGLSTLYAHNSLLKVSNGQRVKRGQIIAYSGSTGYSTGPHLHFSTYATQGVQVKRLGDVSSRSFYCRDSVIPIISLNAYLDPYDYLPRPKFSVKTASYGQSGSHVRSLQMMMKHERIFPIEVSANGYYGDITAKAVKEWQKKYGLGNTDGKSFGSKSVSRYNLLFK